MGAVLSSSRHAPLLAQHGSSFALFPFHRPPIQLPHYPKNLPNHSRRAGWWGWSPQAHLHRREQREHALRVLHGELGRGEYPRVLFREREGEVTQDRRLIRGTLFSSLPSW